MKDKIHPRYGAATVTCACGNTFLTRATKPDIRIEICSQCHPFFTGRQKILDTEGRVERFKAKYAGVEGKTAARRRRAPGSR